MNDPNVGSQSANKNKIVVSKLPSPATAYPAIQSDVITFKELNTKSKSWILLAALLVYRSDAIITDVPLTSYLGPI